LEGITNYRDRYYPHSAESTVRTIDQRIRSLKTSPYRGGRGYRSGTRELPLMAASLPGRLFGETETIEILHINHGSQDWR
jgi:plasmid stabilization system protein ParE